jgi:uncharacterized protein
MKALSSALCFGAVIACSHAAPIEPLPGKVSSRLPDAAEMLSPSAVHLEGFLGDRVTLNAKNRLLLVDEEPLLAGFRRKPGVHPWIGEHVGKWMYAATLAWAYTGDPALRTKLDRVAAELVKAQEPDGYLGTYVPEKRFGLFEEADWDVWSHKYCLMGLLTYYQYTGDEAALNACRKMGDLLIRTFGPGKKSILSAGTHVGMAATSVLEPVVLLYRFTGDDRYLDFARYLVKSWDEPKGPKILATLLQEKQVNRTANGKAYEMLSNLVGLCELARVTGDRQLLQAALNAWEDIVAKRLYITGSASQGEHFRGDYELPNGAGANVAETCVTTTWIQLNSQLLRLTGEARFGDELERTFFNHLAAAQRPDGAQWCYFTALEGTKPYGPGINCCVSSGPRGMALVPQTGMLLAMNQAEDCPVVLLNQFLPAEFMVPVNGTTVTIEERSQFPAAGRMTLVVRTPLPVRFALALRTPAWAQPLTMEGGPGRQQGALKNGWTVLPAREWKGEASVPVTFNLSLRLVLGDHGNIGRAALLYGPLVLAYDTTTNPNGEPPAFLEFAGNPGEAPAKYGSGRAGDLKFEALVRSAKRPEPHPAVFVPFANAGGEGGRYQVWLRAPGAELPKNESLLAFASENRSDPGNVAGSIADGDLETFVVTFNGRPQPEAWFDVRIDQAVKIGRIVFAHGQDFHDGGWFDASAGKPKVQVRRTKDGPWETVGELADYPATTAAENAGLKPGQAFVLKLAQPIEVLAVRVIGTPASGDNAAQAFASCAELQAFAN